MTVNTAKVSGRRTLHFNTLDEVLLEAERVVHSPVRVLGNWTVGQNLEHCARAIDAGFEPVAFRAPWYFRWFIVPFIKNNVLTKPMGAGIRLPKSAEPAFAPEDVSAEAGLDHLRQSLQRLKHETPTQLHPFFGLLAKQEWVSLTLRHCELHLSFIIPEE